MPSRKKAKSKARKAAKEAAQEEQNKAAVAAANQRQVVSLETQLQRLGINPTSQECRHGLDKLSPICKEFIHTFCSTFISQTSALDAFKAADMATAGQKFAEVRSSNSKMNEVIWDTKSSSRRR